MRTFNHVGIVTTEQVEGAMFNEGLKVWLTDYSKSPNRIEFLKFEEGSCLPELVQKQGHCLHRSFFGGRVERQEGDLRPGRMRRTPDDRFHRRRRHRHRNHGNQIITLITYLNKGGIYHVRHKDKIYK